MCANGNKGLINYRMGFGYAKSGLNIILVQFKMQVAKFT
jgi:hypothetical protein